MAIRVQYQPAASVVDRAARAGGRENRRRHEEGLALQYGQLRQRAALQQNAQRHQARLQASQQAAAFQTAQAREQAALQRMGLGAGLQQQQQLGAAALRERQAAADFQRQQQLGQQQFGQRQQLAEQQFGQRQELSEIDLANRIRWSEYQLTAGQRHAANRLEAADRHLQEARARGELSPAQYEQLGRQLAREKLELQSGLSVQPTLEEQWQQSHIMVTVPGTDGMQIPLVPDGDGGWQVPRGWPGDGAQALRDQEHRKTEILEQYHERLGKVQTERAKLAAGLLQQTNFEGERAYTPKEALAAAAILLPDPPKVDVEVVDRQAAPGTALDPEPPPQPGEVAGDAPGVQPAVPPPAGEGAGDAPGVQPAVPPPQPGDALEREAAELNLFDHGAGAGGPAEGQAEVISEQLGIGPPPEEAIDAGRRLVKGSSDRAAREVAGLLHAYRHNELPGDQAEPIVRAYADLVRRADVAQQRGKAFQPTAEDEELLRLVERTLRLLTVGVPEAPIDANGTVQTDQLVAGEAYTFVGPGGEPIVARWDGAAFVPIGVGGDL